MLIVGLGNPGDKYASTPHSVGFEAVDAVAREIGAGWENKRAFESLIAKGEFAGRKVILAKPQTFMNLSGEAVKPLLKYHNLSAADLIVVQDDIDLPLGRIRIRKTGSCGGHNGVRNIIDQLGTSDFVRLKIGVGKEKGNVIGHVLGKFDPASRAVMDEEVAAAAKAAADIVRLGADKAMNAWNGWQPAAGSAAKA